MNNKYGLTLIEIVIALLIFTVMIAAVFNVFLISAEVNRSSKDFSEARALGQSQLEDLYAKRQIRFEDVVYSLEIEDLYVCNGFSYTTDASSGLIDYNITSNPLICTKTMDDFIIELHFDIDTSSTLVKTRIVVSSTNPSIKRYETLYAQNFN
jgi:prepilin-type N-terminal cleavage/methylation domain-containing protein